MKSNSLTIEQIDVINDYKSNVILTYNGATADYEDEYDFINKPPKGVRIAWVYTYRHTQRIAYDNALVLNLLTQESRGLKRIWNAQRERSSKDIKRTM